MDYEEFYGEVGQRQLALDGAANGIAGALASHMAYLDGEFGLDGLSEAGRADLERVRRALDLMREASDLLGEVIYD